jgi:predicted PurR-regulated permease PerM
MRVTRQGGFWIAVGVAGLIVLYLIHSILLPFVVGAVGAYLLVPVVDRMEYWGMNRPLATLSVVGLFAVVIIGGSFIMFPVLVGEIKYLIDRFPSYIVHLQSVTADASSPFLRNLFGEELNIEKGSADVVSKLGSSWLDETLRSMLSGGLAVISLLSLMIVAPIVSIYLIIDWRSMITTIDHWLAPQHRDDVREVVTEINDTISGFVRGQFVICVILALFYVFSLSAIGLRHALVLGLTAGLISFIPYVGAATGLLLSVCVALVQFWPNWPLVAVTGGVFIIGEAVADYILSPRIIGRRVKLHPVWLIFALSAFGWLLGFVGLLVAVPLAAAFGVLLRYAFARSQAATRPST